MLAGDCPRRVEKTRSISRVEQTIDCATALGHIGEVKRKRNGKIPGMDPKVLMAYDRWVYKHLDEMSRKYPHKVIAVYRNKLIAVGDSFKEVYAAAREQGIEERPFAMEVPTVEDLDVIL